MIKNIQNTIFIRSVNLGSFPKNPNLQNENWEMTINGFKIVLTISRRWYLRLYFRVHLLGPDLNGGVLTRAFTVTPRRTCVFPNVSFSYGSISYHSHSWLWLDLLRLILTQSLRLSGSHISDRQRLDAARAVRLCRLKRPTPCVFHDHVTGTQNQVVEA